jgi:hypothetical protein
VNRDEEQVDYVEILVGQTAKSHAKSLEAVKAAVGVGSNLTVS